ncbi:MAG: hypothetical protein KatS3mg110_3360 [Pirellulaceae bacterium]|nr:MAG: hypothetical protein KatS3mg110_3360 [Pirellulaceae bacterium]
MSAPRQADRLFARREVPMLGIVGVVIIGPGRPGWRGF